MTSTALQPATTTPATLVEAVAPAPEPATVEAVRTALGRRRPPGAPRDADPADRLDLLGAALTPETAALAVLWLASTRRSGSGTRTAYADDLLHWALWYARTRGGRFDLATLTRADVTLWLAEQQGAGAAASTVARRLAALSSLYRYAGSYGLPLASPVTEDHRPAVDRGRGDTSARVLTDAETDALYAACGDVRDALVVALLHTDGLRVSELCAADRDDVLVEGRRGVLRVVRKGGRVVRVPLDPAVSDLLDAYDQLRPTWAGDGPVPLVLDAEGARIDRYDVARMLRRIARAAGLRDPGSVTPHSLRATAITALADSGRPITEVQGWAGHADVRTTTVYIERHQAAERNAAMSAELAQHLAVLPPWVIPRHEPDAQRGPS